MFPTLIIIALFPLAVKAYYFDPDYLISDHDLTNHQSMNLEEIQDFLQRAGGTLGTYSVDDIDGKKKSAAEIIYRASQEYKINPQLLITLIQREKSLVTKKSPTKDDYNWATGFTCYDYSRLVSKFRGFARQVDRAAWRFRYYLEHPWQFQFRVGIETKTLVNSKDSWLVREYGKFIIPKNVATAGLYNYAPHLYDNWLFGEIWQKWFAKKDEKIPNGTLVRVENEDGVWLIQNDQRRPFHSKNVFLLSYDFKDVKVISRSDFEAYEIGQPMSFPNYSLVQFCPNTNGLEETACSGDIFMLVSDEKRPISEKVFKAIGFRPEEIIKVDESDLSSYKIGSAIISPYPTGALLQNSDSKSVYYVREDIKYPIVDAEILNANFPYSHIIKVSPQELAEFKNGEPIRFRDGTLIKTASNPAVYVISEEKRLPVFSEETFEALGYRWERIIIVSEPILNMHSLGEVLRIE